MTIGQIYALNLSDIRADNPLMISHKATTMNIVFKNQKPDTRFPIVKVEK